MSISPLQKITVCLLAGLITAHTAVRIGGRFLYPWIPARAMLGVGGLILAAIVLAFAGNRKNAGALHAEKVFSFWIGLLRYSIALDLIMVGLQKWFNLQFTAPIAKLDLPFSSFGSEDLAWAFFGHSHGFVFVIGGLQILGSVFLLYNRTRLLGTVLLIPILFNIVLMDLFYRFNPGESASAFILLSGLTWLLLLDYQKLVVLFLPRKGSYPNLAVNGKLGRNMIRLSALAIPLAMIAIDPRPYLHSWFSGKYIVRHLLVNGRPRVDTYCADSTLTRVYFDQGNECVFEFNSVDRRLFGTYTLNSRQDQISVIWHYPKTIHDTLRATLSGRGTENLVLSGTMAGNDCQGVLQKAE